MKIDPEIRARAKRLRREMTPEETLLWAELRRKKLLGFKFRRQHPLGPYITDFCCPECRLVVEVDGAVHAESQEYDANRTGWLNTRGYRVIRFTNIEVNESLELVIGTIQKACLEVEDGRDIREKL